MPFLSTHGIVALSLPLLNSCERHWFFKVKVKWMWNFNLVSWPVLGGSLILLVTSCFRSFWEKNSKNSSVSWKSRQRASISGLGFFFGFLGELQLNVRICVVIFWEPSMRDPYTQPLPNDSFFERERERDLHNTCLTLHEDREKIHASDSQHIKFHKSVWSPHFALALPHLSFGFGLIDKTCSTLCRGYRLMGRCLHVQCGCILIVQAQLFIFCFL